MMTGEKARKNYSDWEIRNGRVRSSIFCGCTDRIAETTGIYHELIAKPSERLGLIDSIRLIEGDVSIYATTLENYR